MARAETTTRATSSDETNCGRTVKYSNSIGSAPSIVSSNRSVNERVANMSFEILECNDDVMVGSGDVMIDLLPRVMDVDDKDLTTVGGGGDARRTHQREKHLLVEKRGRVDGGVMTHRHDCACIGRLVG